MGSNDESNLLSLYAFVFFSQFQPASPFFVNFLLDTMHFSNHQVFARILNLFIFSKLPCVALVGLLSEVPGCSSRSLLILGAICNLVTNVLTRLGTVLWMQQFAEFTIAFSMASHITIMSLVFATSPQAQFQKSVHTVHAVLLVANFFSAVLGEVLRDVAGFSVSLLYDLTIAGQIMSLLCAVSLPSSPLDYTLRQGELDSVQRDPTAPQLASKICSATLACRAVAQLKLPLVGLWHALCLPVVTWWTLWSLAMVPAHALTLTYWQSLVRAKNIRRDHNGYVMAIMYLIAAALTVGTRHVSPLRRLTSPLVISSMLGAGCILWRFVVEPSQLQTYGWLLLYTCLYHVSSVVGTFQVGAEITRVTKACKSQEALCEQTHDQVRVPRVARLTLLFSVTGIMGSINANIFQTIISRQNSIQDQLKGIGWSLGAFAAVLGLLRGVEVLRNCCYRKANASSTDLGSGVACASDISAPLIEHEG